MTPAWLLGICKPLGTITVMFGVACRLAVAGAGEPVRETVPTGEVAQWRLAVTLHAPVATTATLNLTAVGDRVTAAWCLEPVAKPAGKAPHTLLLDPAGLKASVRGLTGTMTGQLCVDDNTYTAMRPITLTVETSDDGSLKGHLSGTLRMLDGTVGHDRPIRGVITGGQRRSADELQRHNQLPPALSWPCWMGPNQNFSATPTATAVVSDIRAARLVWRSETLGPPEMGSYRYGLCAGRRPAAGGASPIVAGGRVFVFVVVPTGEVHSRTHIDKCLADPRFANQVKRLEAMGLDDKSLAHTWAIDADEQVLALDAATGQTLWKTTWPRAGLHMHDHKCGLTNHTGYATADQVFVFGSLGVVRCLSATDGAVLWETAVPGYHQTQVALKARSLAEGHANVPTRSYAHALNAAVPEGVLLAPTAPGDSGLVGLSMRDGRLLWRVERKILGAKVTPMVWRGSGATLALAVITDPATGEGTLTAVDVSSGQVAWTLADLGGNEYQPALAGDVLILNDYRATKETGGPHQAQQAGRMAAWTVTALGATRLWTTPDGSGMAWFRATAAVDGGVAAVRHLRTVRLIDLATGRELARDELPRGRHDESHTSAMNGVFFPEMDSQHGTNGFYTRPANPAERLAALWHPSHPHATTYAVPMSHAWVDGRLFLRGRDGLYCYDLRAPGAPFGGQPPAR